MNRVCCAFGTRPKAIKTAPVVLALRTASTFDVDACVTAQHRRLLYQVLEIFSIKPDCDLDLMRPDQSLTELSARVLVKGGRHLDHTRPDMVLVQGDTTTVLCAALAAFYRRIPVGHVEAGLRTSNIHSPWPEEANRKMTSAIATLHFAPTKTARRNLLREGVPDQSIFVTGNTVIDALLMVLERVRAAPPQVPGLPPWLQPKAPDGGRWLVLATGHPGPTRSTARPAVTPYR